MGIDENAFNNAISQLFNFCDITKLNLLSQSYQTINSMCELCNFVYKKISISHKLPPFEAIFASYYLFHVHRRKIKNFKTVKLITR